MLPRYRAPVGPEPGASAPTAGHGLWAFGCPSFFFGFWCGQAALATGTAWAGICLIHHHLARLLSPYALLIRSAVAAFGVWPLLAAGVACCLMCGCAGLRNAKSRRRTTTSAVSLFRGLKPSSKKVYKKKASDHSTTPTNAILHTRRNLRAASVLSSLSSPDKVLSELRKSRPAAEASSSPI